MITLRSVKAENGKKSNNRKKKENVTIHVKNFSLFT